MSGRTIAHYELLEKLGEGGMGVVYKARDAHLDRFVAIKLLPPEKVADPERKRRFVQEAKAASALNHPNIVTIHDIGHADGIDYIAMEYVAGKTLDQLIGRKGLKLADALNYAIQIADALAKTHSAGIVHRDLKPSNLMVGEDGRVKVLDFGLAKLTEPVAPASAGEFEPTRTVKPHTEEGTIMGTVAYMSPEQAEGKAVDARSDIFSFGSVLYEMLTGQRAFQGESKISTLSAILHQDPKPASELSGALPREVERVLNRCLRKDPQRRWQTMSDLKIALQDVKEESDSGKLAGPAPRKAASRRWWWVAGAAVLVAAGATGMAWRYLRRASPALDLAVVRVTFDSGLTAYPALSADGKLIAYASDRSGEGHLDIYVQHASGGQPSRLTTNPADDYAPSFAPDGSRIAFRSERQGGGIWVVDVLGGVERKLVDEGSGPKYSPDGSMIAYLQESPSLDPFENKVFLIPAQGGPPRQILQGFGIRSLGSGASVWWSPDGKHLLFAGLRAGQLAVPDWWVAPIDGGPPVATGAAKSLTTTLPHQFPLAWFGRHVYFYRGSLVEGIHLFRAPIESGVWQISGVAQRLTSGTGSTFAASFATDGSLLFGITNPEVQFFSLPMDGKTRAVSGAAVKLTSDAAIKGAASLSEDGKSLAYTAFASWEARRIEIRVRSLVTGKESTYSSNTFTRDLAPQLNSDGSLVAYVDSAGGKPAAFVGPPDSLPGRQACEGCEVMGFFPGSRQILVRYGATRLVRQDLDTGAQSPVLELRRGTLLGARGSFLNSARLAPDGRRIALVVALPGGSVRLFVAPVKDAPSPEQEWVGVLPEGEYGLSPAWSADGGMLYYLGRRDGHLCVWAQRLSAGTSRPAGESVAVHHLHQHAGLLGTLGVLRFVTSARDRLVFPVWTSTGNLWRTKVVQP